MIYHIIQNFYEEILKKVKKKKKTKARKKSNKKFLLIKKKIINLKTCFLLIQSLLKIVMRQF